MIGKRVVIREGVTRCKNLLFNKSVCKELREYVFSNGMIRCYRCGAVKSGNVKETAIRD